MNVADLFDHPRAHLAADDLAELHDSIGIAPHGPDAWLITIWDRPICGACEGSGRDEERSPAPCTACGGIGRERGAEYAVTDRIILHADGHAEPYRLAA